jgi:hypothetical protein
MCSERSDRLGVEEPADRITKDNSRLIRSSSSTSVAVTTATRQKRHDNPIDDDKPFGAHENTDEEQADHDLGFEAGREGKPNDDTKSLALAARLGGCAGARPGTMKVIAFRTAFQASLVPCALLLQTLSLLHWHNSSRARQRTEGRNIHVWSKAHPSSTYGSWPSSQKLDGNLQECPRSARNPKQPVFPR